MIDHSHHHVEHHVNVHSHTIAHQKQSVKKITPQKKHPSNQEKLIAKKNHASHHKNKTLHTLQKTTTTKHHYHATAQTAPKHKKSINVSKFAHTLTRNAYHRSTEKCAKHVRLALESAGAQVKSHPVAAADWGQTLEKIGYKRISPAFDKPQEGDIYIIVRTKTHGYGHIAGYTGKNWVSDFRQNSYAVYGGSATYKYYRLS
ncbi:CHAP domain-containing protein [Acinetobacter baretiae]|uniref:CHAP domain-containing protein n=1 Tax=Acinetobacter baretiae TaxID=2605383 RepID=UPI001BB34198